MINNFRRYKMKVIGYQIVNQLIDALEEQNDKALAVFIHGGKYKAVEINQKKSAINTTFMKEHSRKEFYITDKVEVDSRIYTEWKRIRRSKIGAFENCELLSIETIKYCYVEKLTSCPNCKKPRGEDGMGVLVTPRPHCGDEVPF